MSGMTLGDDFFDHPKKHQKMDPSKLYSFGHFEGFWKIVASFFANFGRFGGPPGVIFGDFLGCFGGVEFSSHFFKKMKNEKNEKVHLDLYFTMFF